MVRELADYRPENVPGVLRWPIREALIAYRVRVRAVALHDYERDLAIWAAIAPHSSKRSDPPKPPPILREIAQ
jgi:hypothetical protein